ncbi:MAG: Gfo/Idh/MocA family oxidoreductase [Desulfobacterales bacterium]|nr:Gfo/Idh/MocA family oxidoreductase [Desulfobacterales bacterium]
MTNHETIDFGIVGTGMVADYYLEAVRANAENGAGLAAVSTRDPEKFGAASEKFGVPCISNEALMDHPGVDVVCICTPSGYHAEQAMAAARAGKHAIVEKPMALTLADADAMIEAFSRADLMLGVSLQRRAEPLFRVVHDAIKAGDLGELTSGVVTIPYRRDQAYYNLADWRGTWSLDGGGVLMNQGIHLVDVLIWCMGDPVEIQARAATLHQRIEVEDSLAATLRFENGSMATIMATTLARPGFPHRVEIYGTNGGIQIEGEAVAKWSLADPGKASIEPPETGCPVDAGAGSDPRGVKATGHINLIENFMDAIRGKAPLLIDGREGRRSLAAVLGVYKAAGLISEY